MTNDAKKVTVSPLAVGIGGAIIGAAGAIIAIALSDKNNRKKVTRTFNDVKVWGDKKMQEMRAERVNVKKGDNDLDKLEDKLDEQLERSKKSEDLSGRESGQVVK